MEGYGQFCPVSKAAEVLCQRWTPLIVRELLVGSTRFNELRRGVPKCSPALLSKRLKELEATGIVDRIDKGNGVVYHLTEAGQELLPVIEGLGVWGHRWVRTNYGATELDPGLLLWDVRRNLTPGGMAGTTTTIQFVFPKVPVGRRFYWLVDDTHEVDLCVVDPGRDIDLTVEADLATLTRVWLGDARFAEEVVQGRIAIEGPTRLTRRFEAWFGRHPLFAAVPRG